MIGWVHGTVSVQQLTPLELNSLDNAFSFHSVLEVTGVENLILLTIFAYNSVLEFGRVENPILLTIFFHLILFLELLEWRTQFS